MADDILFSELKVGDIFHASCGFGARAICLVTEIRNDRVIARVVTTQMLLEFDLSTASAPWPYDGHLCFVDPILTLPKDIDVSLRELDRKYNLQHPGNDPRLQDTHIVAILFYMKLLRTQDSIISYFRVR